VESLAVLTMMACSRPHEAPSHEFFSCKSLRRAFK
jgi:hypothetical protein